jgi:hypothetical protein
MHTEECSLIHSGNLPAVLNALSDTPEFKFLRRMIAKEAKRRPPVAVKHTEPASPEKFTQRDADRILAAHTRAANAGEHIGYEEAARRAGVRLDTPVATADSAPFTATPERYVETSSPERFTEAHLAKALAFQAREAAAGRHPTWDECQAAAVGSTVEKFTQQAVPTASVERYTQQVQTLAAEIHSKASRRGVSLSWDQATAKAREKLAAV